MKEALAMAFREHGAVEKLGRSKRGPPARQRTPARHVVGVSIWCAAVVSLVAPAAATDRLSQPDRTPGLRSATTFLSPELKAEQADDLKNRAMLWVEQGAELWGKPEGPDGVSCRSCHQEARSTMRGVAAALPRFDLNRNRVLNLEGQINACRTDRQKTTPLAYESNELLALTAYLSLQSRGLPKAMATTPAIQPALDAGRAFWFERQGQFNLSCAQCHDDHVGRKLRGDTISSAVPTGYPAYRLEWNGLGSLHRRLKACQLGVRAVQFEAGSEEYLALEVYLAWRARGEHLEAPAMRR
jgi:sulfur-oxidizing protein SoxA